MTDSFELIFLMVYLTGRLLFYDIENIGSGRKKGFIKRILFGLTALFFSANLVAGLLIIFLHAAAVLFDSFVLTRKDQHLLKIYFAHLFFVVLIASFTASILNYSEPFVSNPIQTFAALLHNELLIFKSMQRWSVEQLSGWTLLGFIFTIKEGTIIIRLVLRKLSAVPKVKEEPDQDDTREYDRGKLIGILERALIYFSIVFNQLGAVAIIIALKSLARFKELDDKNFAEYFLIGSLLSIIIAVLPAAIIRLFFI